MNVQDVIREMRLYTEDDNYGPDVGRWVIALEAAMREPVATIIEGEDGFRYCDWDSALETGMKLYALPPDAQAEIERLQTLLTRVMVSEGRCAMTLMQDIRAVLQENNQ